MCKSASLIILLYIVMLFSCNNNSDSSEHIIKAVPDKPDTAKTFIATSITSKAYPLIFQAAFDSSTSTKEGDINFSFFPLGIGKIKIETGKIIAGDPVVLFDAIPFTQSFPIGEFPIQLAIARTINDERVAFSRILFSDSTVSKWDFALSGKQTAIPIGEDSIYCYGVDAGTGVFIDSIACVAFNEKDHSEWEKVFINMGEENGYKGHTYDFDGHNLVAFSTGWGDGCYATYIGFDKNGNVCQLLTDFGLVSWWKEKERK
jgi:hypothetical protein